MEPSSNKKWYDSIWAFVVGFAFIGPFALPLLWRSPTIPKNQKILVTILSLIVTAGLIYLFKVVLVKYQDLMIQ